MSTIDTPQDGDFSRLIDQQLELAAARLPALVPGAVHPSPEDHEEIATPHPSFEDVLLGNAQATDSMLDELAALERAPELSDEELTRQALGASDLASPAAG